MVRVVISVRVFYPCPGGPSFATAALSMSMQMQHVRVLIVAWTFQNFALSLVTCAQLSSKARNAHTHIVASYPLFCKLIVFKIMLPTRAGSTLSIFSPFHVGANARCSCLGRFMGLSFRALIATCAFQNSHSRS